MTRPDLEARFAWSRMAEPGDRSASALIGAFGAAEALERLLSIDVHIRNRVVNASYGQLAEAWLARHDMSQARRELDLALDAGLTPVLPGDKEWPARLDVLEAPPMLLWVRGDAKHLAAPSLAITGARACTGYGSFVTAEIASHVARDGVAVLSGAAYGVDAAAHRAALAEGAPTVAVLACGADLTYPRAHEQLLNRIAETGCVVSEAPPGALPTRGRFLARQRLIAALSSALLVTEAGARSGSLGAARHAKRLGRPTGAVPGPVTSAASAGCHVLLQEGTAQLVTGGEDAVGLLLGGGEA